MPNGDAQQSATALNRWLKTQKIHSAGLLSKGIALGAFNGIVMVVQMALLANIIDLAVFKKFELQALQPWLLSLLGLVLVRAALLFASEWYNRRGAMAIKQRIRGQLLARLFERGPSFSHHYGTAKLSTLLHQGVDSIEDYFAGYLPVIAYCSVIPGAILLAVFPNDWRSGLVLMLTAPLVPFFMILIGHQAQKLNQQHWARLLRMSSHFLDVIQGLTQLKIFNASRREIDAVKNISEDFGNQTMAILKVAFLSSFMLEFLASIAIALVAVILGFRLLYGEVDYVLALWVLLLAPEFYLPVRQLGAQYHAKMAGVSAAQDMIDILQDDLLNDEFLL
ncbi:MAG: thiol reductant ABC exporter subunit CydD, partial [Psychrobium sp.]|nr:thiol reductant ABC exporter subunit CydD [Psychrobium sp.]